MLKSRCVGLTVGPFSHLFDWRGGKAAGMVEKRMVPETGGETAVVVHAT